VNNSRDVAASNIIDAARNRQCAGVECQMVWTYFLQTSDYVLQCNRRRHFHFHRN